MTLTNRYSKWSAVLLALCTMVASPNSFAAESAAEKEQKLISVLKSDAPGQEKAITCKRLAIYGSKEAVPALAPLLSDERLASWARIALEAIPDPAADDALKEALGKLNGKLLVGVINSIGVRRDGKAVGTLIAKLKDSDPEVAAAAGEALGHIGGEQASAALSQALNRTRGDFTRQELAKQSAIAYGCILAADKFVAQGKASEAIKLYESVRQANVPKQNVLEANRGLILARGAEGTPLLLEQLRSNDKAAFMMGLRTARELPGRSVTETLVAELEKANPDKQLLVLRAVADRGDAAVKPKLLEIAKAGSPELRAAAIGLLDRYADISCMPVLLTAAADENAELSRAAKASLGRLGGKEVDAEIVTRLGSSSGKSREVLTELAAQRRIESAMPAIVKGVEDADAGVRRVALEAVGAMGTEQQAAELVRVLPKVQNAKDRDDIETALTSICGRSGAKCLPHVLSLARSTDTGLRNIGLHTLASIGGTEALGAVKSAVNDQDASVQNEAVKILSTWPNKWPEDDNIAEPLLALAKSAPKASHQVQGLRGYLLYLQESKKSNDEKVAKLNEILPLIKSPEQKRLTISVLGNLAGGGGLNPLITFADDKEVAEEACLALVRVATAREQKATPKDVKRKALQAAIEKSKNDATRKKAEEALTKL